jgi:tRNA-modifying protein YgfZ
MRIPRRERLSFFDLSARAKFRVGGSDRLRFLNGQITNDVRLATATEAIEACVLNAKGKIDAHLFVSLGGEFYFLDTDEGLREALPLRLERYVISDDVEIEEVTGDFGIFHILSSVAPAVPDEWRMVRVRRFGESGWDVWVERSEVERARQFFSKRFLARDGERAETLRIELGLPRWGRELTGGIIPIEANLEQRCIDYSKGCYIGQEVISRMKMSGQTNKKLCGLVPLDGNRLVTGMRLNLLSEPAREAGWVTSVANSAKLQRPIALGFVKRGFYTPGTQLSASDPDQPAVSLGDRVEVVALPFV